MGFESFRVELHGGPGTSAEVIEAIRDLDHITADETAIPTPGSHYFVMRDGRHVIEMESTQSPVSVSCRFTLCHPPSVEAVFLAIVRTLMDSLEMQVKICDDVLPEHAGNFSRDTFDAFTRAVLPYIAARRSVWKATFGNQPLAVSTNEVHQRIILPLCQNAVEKAG